MRCDTTQLQPSVVQQMAYREGSVEDAMEDALKWLWCMIEQ